MFRKRGAELSCREVGEDRGDLRREEGGVPQGEGVKMERERN